MKRLIFCMLFCLAGCRSEVKEDPFASLCRNQMEIIYKAVIEFSKDHNGNLPPAYIAPECKSSLGTHGNWYIMLVPYLEKMGKKTTGTYVKNKRQPEDTIFHCPANPYWYGGFGPYCSNYIWNRNLGAYSSKTKNIRLIKFQDILNKDKTILMTDSGIGPKTRYNRITTPYMGNRKKDIGFWHEGKANVLFLDGHVELLSPSQITPAMFKIKLK